MRLQCFSEEVRWLFEASPALNMLYHNKSHAVDGGLRLQDARGDRLLGNAMVVKERHEVKS